MDTPVPPPSEPDEAYELPKSIQRGRVRLWLEVARDESETPAFRLRRLCDVRDYFELTGDTAYFQLTQAEFQQLTNQIIEAVRAEPPRLPWRGMETIWSALLCDPDRFPIRRGLSLDERLGIHFRP